MKPLKKSSIWNLLLVGLKHLMAVFAGVVGTLLNTRLLLGVGKVRSVFPAIAYNFNLFVVIVISLPFSFRRSLTFNLGVPLPGTSADEIEGDETDEPLQHWHAIQLLHHFNTSDLMQLSTPELIRLYGYRAESHKVETEDGYILTLHRIPHGKREESISKGRRPVVFLQHGLFASSFEWFMNTPNKLLALQLVDLGYDVWFGNARGNAYSREHVSLSIHTKEYWEFSVHEMGKYDLPGAIDYILAQTKNTEIRYIGFSMGCSMFWIMMSLRPEYNEKVKVMIAMAPVVYISNMKGFPKFLLAPFQNQLRVVVDILFRGEFLPWWLFILHKYIATKLSRNPFIAESFSANLAYLYAGWDFPQTQIEQLPLFFSHAPSPTSARTLAHIAQFINKGIFEEYDWGSHKNMLLYGKNTPSPYSLKNTKVPVVLLWGLNDAVVEPAGVKRLASELSNVIVNQPVNFTLWNHFDYHLAKDVNPLVHQPLLRILSNYR